MGIIKKKMFTAFHQCSKIYRKHRQNIHQCKQWSLLSITASCCNAHLKEIYISIFMRLQSFSLSFSPSLFSQSEFFSFFSLSFPLSTSPRITYNKFFMCMFVCVYVIQNVYVYTVFVLLVYLLLSLLLSLFVRPYAVSQRL